MSGTIKNLLVGQSGGPTAVINASLYGVVQKAFSSPQVGKVYGMLNGISGFLEHRITDLGQLSKEELSLLKTTPGAYLGSCRLKLPEDLTDPIYRKIFSLLEKDQIGYFLYIGGNDSMDTLEKLSRCGQMIHSDISFIGIPKTIDDDLMGTDHTPGYGSAAKFVASQVRQIVLDAETYLLDSVVVVEIMGRNAGWLTAASLLARRYPNDNPVLIYLPEVDFSGDAMLAKIKEHLEKRHSVVVCISEGIHDKNGRLVCEMQSHASSDVFGHKQLAGAGKILEDLIRSRLKVKVRSIELNVPQRASAIEASLTDVSEAVLCGEKGTEAALQKVSGEVVVMERVSDDPYQIQYKTVPARIVSNAVRFVPKVYITEDDSNVKEAFLTYASPLIQGESRPPMENGLPKFLYRQLDHSKSR